MQVNVEELSATERKVSITVPATDVDEAFNKAYRQVGKSASVPGFRPGKVPKGLLEVHYGPQVRNEVENKLVTDTLYKALHEESIQPIGMPKIETGDLKKGTDFAYTADVEIQPPIEVKQYKHLVAPPVEVKVEQEEIDAELDKLRQQAMQMVPVLVRDTVEKGDFVLMDYEGSIGGVAFPGGKGEGALIEIGGQDYLPGFSEGLEGAKVPSERTFPIDFPEDYTAKELAGKQASFSVQIKEIKKQELPELDDDFAQDLGEEDLEALKTKLVGSMKERKEQEAQGERRTTLLKALVEANSFELPKSMIDAQSERMIAGAAQRVQQMMGQQLQLSEDDLASLRKDNRGEAEFQVRCGLLLLEIAEKEGLKVDAAAMDAEIAKVAAGAGGDAARVQAHYANPDNRRQLEYRLLEDQTVDFLFEHAVASEAEAKKAAKEAPKKADKKTAATTKGDGEKKAAKATKKTAKKTTKAATKKTAKKPTTKKAATKKTTKKAATKKKAAKKKAGKKSAAKK